VNSFLIVRLGSLGDVVHAIPVAAALRAEFPHARIDWTIDPRYMGLLELVTVVDRRIGLDPRDVFRGTGTRFFRTFGEMRGARYDAVIDLQGLVKSALLARAARGLRTIGFPRKHLREPLARLFYTDAPDPGAATHVIYKNLSLLDPLGVKDRSVRFPLAVPASPTVDAVVRRFAPEGFALLNPGAAWPNKRWPPACFGAVAAAIRQAHGLRSLVLWGPGEQGLAHEVEAASAGAAQAAPPTTIKELVGLARAARLMISGDTGPLHVAGAVGTPIIALFGPTQPERNGPWGLHDVTISRVDRCVCLYERRCKRAMPCIIDIGVDEVLEGVDRRMAVRG
jgi:heptosyltransferase I